MAIDDVYLQMFFEEARELLLRLEECLMELERHQGDRAHLDKTFRAAHTIKGAAAMVGLSALAEFTHGIEAVLDRVRSAALAVDSDVISTLLEARDHLAGAVEAEAAGTPIPAPPELIARLATLIRDPAAGGRGPAPGPASASGPSAMGVAPRAQAAPSPAAESEPAAQSPPADQIETAGARSGFEPADIASSPTEVPPGKSKKPRKPRAARGRAKPASAAASAGAASAEGTAAAGFPAAEPAVGAGGESYRITFIPGPDVMRRGVNPLGVLDELRELGRAIVATEPGDVPPLDELDPERCYLSWIIDLDTDAGHERLDDVFLFLADDSQVTIEQRGADGHFTVLRFPGGRPGAAAAASMPAASAPEPFTGMFALGASPGPLSTPAGAPVTAAGAAGAPETAAVAPAPGVPRKVGPPAGQAGTVPSATPQPPGAAAGQPASAALAARRPPQRIRVDATQLDDLVGLAGELAVLSDNLQGLREMHGSENWANTLEALDRVSRLIRDSTLELRMVPVEELFLRFPRVVRDLADRSGKEIELRIEGQETRLDRTIIERLSEPMIHLIRNAVDHGLETPEERLRAGKPRMGRISLWAGHEGDRVALRIEEDGRGLDRERIVRKGIAAGLVPMGTSADDPRVDGLIFEPGFSTRDQVSELSGRGVGLDVVRDAVRGLRGSLGVESVPGKGTAFIFRLPLTLALIDGLLVEAAGNRYVVPLAQVEECQALNGTKPALSKGRPCVSVRGELVPMVPLRRLFKASGPPPTRQELLLTRHSGQRVGVAVDRLLGRVQAVIQGLGEGLQGLGRFSGATILADGSVSLILDLAALVAESRAADNHAAARAEAEVFQ